MTSYNLEVTSVPALSKNKPQQVVVLCHGYGGDGRDISALATNWQRFLPEATFLCPNAPETCKVNSFGYQWFDMTIENDEMILEKSLISEKEILAKIDLRNKARQSKDYKLADKIRKELLDKDVLIEDINDKTTWKYK